MSLTKGRRIAGTNKQVKRGAVGKSEMKNGEEVIQYHNGRLKVIRKEFDLTPAGIIKTLRLREPVFAQTAAYGHFGRTDIDLPWEALDKVQNLISQVSSRV